MKVFHYSMHDGCSSDIKNFLKKYDADLTTIVPKERPHESYIIDFKKANELWELYEKDFLSSDIIIFSDTIPFSRSVLQNLDLISKDTKIILWVTNRFNYAIESDQSYYELLEKIKHDERVYFFYANKFEKIYLNNFVKIPDNKQYFFTPYGKRSKKDFDMTLQKNHNQKLFVMSYQNEKEYYPLYDKLKSLKVDFYNKEKWIPSDEYCGPYDIETCCAVLHIPYAWGTVALWEYMSLGKTFILPSINWLNRTYQERYLFFQTNKSIDLINEYSDWYCEENRNLFIYFDELEEIVEILKDKKLINDKGKSCYNRVIQNNLNNRAIFENIL